MQNALKVITAKLLFKKGILIHLSIKLATSVKGDPKTTNRRLKNEKKINHFDKCLVLKQVYTEVSDKNIRKIISPLDNLKYNIYFQICGIMRYKLATIHPKSGRLSLVCSEYIRVNCKRQRQNTFRIFGHLCKCVSS